MKRKIQPPEPAQPEPPTGLSAESQALWRGCIGKCLTAARMELLRQACHALDRSSQARALVGSEGLVSVTKSTGAAHIHPALKVEVENRRQFAAIVEQLELGSRWEPGGILGPIESR